MEPPTYVLEAGFDFYKELYGGIGDGGSESTVAAEESAPETCLITHQPLQSKHIKLACGHSFNYFPLCQELANYKTKFMVKERLSNQLCASKIRCPYCRTKCKNLNALEKVGVAPLFGVNSSKRVAMRVCVDPEKRCHHVYPRELGLDIEDQRCLAEMTEGSEKCAFHQTWPPVLPDIKRCTATLKKSGEGCPCPSLAGAVFCGRHFPKPKNQQTTA